MEAGQRPQRGRSPVEHRGIFVRSSILGGLSWGLGGLCSGLGGLSQGLGGELGPQDGWTNGRTDERMAGQKFPLCSTGLRPLWGRCPASTQNHLNKYVNQYINEQGKDIADHILPLGD